MHHQKTLIFTLLFSFILLAGCVPDTPLTDDMILPEIDPVSLDEGEKLAVVASTSIIGDIVAGVGGDAIDLTILIPLGQNPHSYEPTPAAFSAVERADLIYVNGLGLEEALLESLVEVGRGAIIPVSAGIEVLDGAMEDEDEEAHEDESAHDHIAGDPHFWVDPNNVMVWVENIRLTLSAADPASEAAYQANADAMLAALVALDATIREQVATIPEANRKLVTDHGTFTYFADEYGFEIVGTVIPSFSTTTGASAGDIAALVALIREEEVPAIFIGSTANESLQTLAMNIAAETGEPIQVLSLLTGSLALAGEPGDTYFSYMAYNLEQIVTGLGG